MESEPNVYIHKMAGYLRKRTKPEWTFVKPGQNLQSVPPTPHFKG